VPAGVTLTGVRVRLVEFWSLKLKLNKVVLGSVKCWIPIEDTISSRAVLF
jgi:hypothetical protein